MIETLTILGHDGTGRPPLKLPPQRTEIVPFADGSVWLVFDGVQVFGFADATPELVDLLAELAGEACAKRGWPAPSRVTA